MSLAPSARSAWKGRRTPRGVGLVDLAMGVLIRLGGTFVIVAVLGICVFLVAVVVPLFGGAKASAPVQYSLPAAQTPGARLLFAELNEYWALGVAVHGDGALDTFDGATGARVSGERLAPADAQVTAWSRAPAGGHTALGLADGRVILSRLGFSTTFVDEVPGGSAAEEGFKKSGRAVSDLGVAERTPLGQIRLNAVALESDEPLPLVEGSSEPVRLVDYRAAGTEEVVAALCGSSRLVLAIVSRRVNIATGNSSMSLDVRALPYSPMAGFEPARLVVSGRGDQLYLAGARGRVLRYDLRDLSNPSLAETTELTGGKPLTFLGFAFGDQSLLATSAGGKCTSWFRVPADDRLRFPDGYRLVPAHEHEAQDGDITALGVSIRNKCFLTGGAGGSLWLRHMTSGQTLAKLSAAGGAPLASVQITPKADGVFGVRAGGEAELWSIHCPHPETTPGTVFGKVWYEGYGEPLHTWQSSSGTDDFEPKFGLVPLIFGTLKATVYALAFAVPIALLAAIYTSEMMSRRSRALVKPLVELMASLPSVVLGFLAALVLAPLAEHWILSLLSAIFIVPAAVVLASSLWLFVPAPVSFRLEGWPKLIITTVVFAAALAGAFPLGRWLEAQYFLGDFQAWLAPPRRGTGTVFWAGLLFPLGAIAAGAGVRRLQARFGAALTGIAGAAVELFKAIAVLAAGLALSTAMGWCLTGAGLDPRDALIGTYVQRNTMIVGFVMGFAVIPIIYTIAEDALSAVPEHLRGAALGCGATPWQTALHIIVPTALSGIFSAIMVGMGRAVGETMIVVMAAGNTPIIDVNPFNGLRALSATIAVELPEAVKDGTLYRMLFLAALTLFAMTFVINTAAEVVRQRFRKRAFQL